MKIINIFLSLTVLISVSNLCLAQIPSNVPTNGLAGYWPFNGNANDESGNNNNGAVFGATSAADRFGDTGKAFSFDGVNDYIEIPNSNSLNPTSISVNVWINADSSDMCILEKNNYSNARETSYRLSHKDSWANNLNGTSTAWGNPTTCNSINYSAVEGSPADTVANNSWQMITFTLTSAGECIQYLNGQYLFTYTDAAFFSCNSSTSKLKIGTHWTGDPEWFRGLIDDIGIWNRVLTAQEVATLYNPATAIVNQPGQHFNIYPNPAQSHITIENKTLNSFTVSISNVLGQQIFQQQSDLESITVNLSVLGAKGVHYLRILDNQGNLIMNKSIVIQ